MATHSIHVTALSKTDQTEEMSIQEAVKILSREEKFMATVYAMNTLLIHKGIYSGEEFDTQFVSWAKAQQKKNKKERPGF